MFLPISGYWHMNLIDKLENDYIYSMKFPIIVKNRLIEQLQILKNEIEACQFPGNYREGIYDNALIKLNDWTDGKIEDDDILTETFLNKKNEVYLAIKLIRTDMLSFESEKKKGKRKEVIELSKLNDEDGEPV